MTENDIADELYLAQRAEAQLAMWEEEEELEMSGPKNLLRGITHCILLMTKSKELAAKTGIHGTLLLCFGPGDENDAIGQIHFVKNGNRFEWRLPYANINGKNYPVLKGKLADEVLELAEQVRNTIHKDLGKTTYGRRYRIANGRAVDETPQESAAGDGGR